MSKKLNNLLSFKDFSELGKIENKPGHVIEKVNYDIDNYEFTNEEWEFAKKIGRKIKGIKTPEEITEKGKKLLADGGEEKLMSYIAKSSNPKLHKKNYDMLKQEGGLPYYSFVIFLFSKKSDLVTKTPLYYKIRDFEITDTTIRTPENPSGT